MNSNSFDKMQKVPCSQIPVRFVESTQSFGVLIAIQKDAFLISHVSENIVEAYGISLESLLGKSIFQFENSPQLKIIASLLKSKNLSTTDPVFSDENNELLYHELETHYLFEWLFFKSKSESELPERYRKITNLFEKIHNCDIKIDKFHCICSELKSIFSFDKVLIYSFLPDGNGEVVGEAREQTMEKYFGLRFPASDVPQQVRDTYIANPLRLVQNAWEKPLKILHQPDQPMLDLTQCLLKGVATIHQDYVKAMNIATSLSLAIIVQNKLWGLLCFHHLTPRELPFQDRFLLKLFAQLLGMLLEINEDKGKLNLEIEVRNKLIDLAHFEGIKGKNFVEIFLPFAPILFNVLRVDGTCISHNGKIETAGKTPPLEFLKGLIDWLARDQLKEYFFTDCLLDKYPPAKEFITTSSGILACRLSPIPNDMIIWFRSDQMTNVYWGGNPDRSQEFADGLRPQHSFSVFVETVTGKSTQWQPNEVFIAKEINEFMKKVIIERLYIENKIIEGEVLQFQLAVDTIDNGIFVLSEDKKILWCNSYFTQFFEQGELKDKDFTEVLKKAEADCLPDLDLTKAKKWDMEIGFGDDPRRFLMLHINLYRIDIIEENRYIGIAYDITKLKKTTEELKTLNINKSNFLRMAAHDLRNPLASILMSAVILKSKEVEPALAKRLNDIIQQQGSLMLDLLNELVDVSVVQGVELSFNVEPTDLHSFFENITFSNKVLFDAKGIDLKTSFLFEEKEANIDKSKVKQVVDNLLSNAIKYSNPGTQVTLKVHASKTQLKVEVEDQGLGIPLNEQDRVFVPLSKLSPKPTGKETSHGVGLSICKWIVNKLGGEIGFTSTPNVGSQFYFYLPLNK